MSFTTVALSLSSFSASAPRTNRLVQPPHDGDVKGDSSTRDHDDGDSGDR